MYLLLRDVTSQRDQGTIFIYDKFILQSYKALFQKNIIKLIHY